MFNYDSFPGLAGVFLEDSYVLGIVESPGRLSFQLDAVLTPEHPAYQPPRPGEQYCYADGTLVFDDVTTVEWLRKSGSHFTDASGEEDLENIDSLQLAGGTFTVAGDWGEVRVTGAQPWFELDG